MKNIKKIISALLALFLMSAPVLLTGCDRQTAGDEGKWSIVTTIFPEYDWVKNLLGEKADRATLTMLLDSGVDLHSYQPTVEDLVKIANCDLFLYVGGGRPEKHRRPEQGQEGAQPSGDSGRSGEERRAD